MLILFSIFLVFAYYAHLLSMEEPDTRRFTPIELACKENRTRKVQKLLKSEKEPNEYKTLSPLILTSLNSNVVLMRSVLKHGANINEQERNSKVTALMCACIFNCPQASNLLLQRNADISIKSCIGKTARMYAVGNKTILDQFRSLEHIEKLPRIEGTRKLLQERFPTIASPMGKSPINIIIAYLYNSSPLFDAIEQANYEQVKECVDKNYNLSLPNNDGFTPTRWIDLQLHNIETMVSLPHVMKQPPLNFKEKFSYALSFIPGMAFINPMNSGDTEILPHSRDYSGDLITRNKEGYSFEYGNPRALLPRQELANKLATKAELIKIKELFQQIQK